MPINLGKMGQRLSQAASSAKEKSKELLDMAKLNKQINDVENEIVDLKEKIGEQFYAAYSAGTEPEHLLNLCEQIDQLQERLADLLKQMDKIKGTSHCPHCNEVLDDATIFCPHCGGKLQAD